jgi:pimeloyl-[acyl-carrier protein] methyl ester esterase
VKHLVLLHGWAMHSGMWGNFAQQLSQHYRVTLIDLSSHDNLDSIVEAVITELDDEPFYLLGWSFGGTVALQMTANFPNRIKGLILMAANPCFVAKENWAGMPIETFNTFSENFHVNSTVTLQKFLSLQLQGSPTFLKETKRLFSSKDPADNLEISLNLLKISDLRDILKNLTCSVTAILSDNDALIPVEIGEKMQALQPNLKTVILKNATHIPFITQPENCLNAISNAIR